MRLRKMPAATSDAPPRLAAMAIWPPWSLLEKEVADHQGVDAGGIEAAHGVARRAYQRLAKEIEGRVVEDGQSRFFAEGVQQLPVERVIVLRYRVHAHQIVCQYGAAELLLVFQANTAHSGEVAGVRSGFEIFGCELGGHRSREFPQGLAVLDEGVEIFGRVGVLGRGQNAAIAESARAELHAPLHPGDDAVFLQAIDRRTDHLGSGGQHAEAQLTVFEHLLDFGSAEGWAQTVASVINPAGLAEEV